MKESTIKTLNNIFIGFAVCIFLILIIGFISTYSENTHNDYNFDEKDDATVKETFLDGCQSVDEFDAYCDCAWDYVSAKYTTAEIVEFGLEYEKTGSLDLAEEVFRHCKDKL